MTAALGLLLAVAAALAAGCAGGARESRAPADDYLRYVGFDLPFNENVLLHWSRRQMPLRVHLPQPPEGFLSKQFGVDRILVTARWRGREPSLDTIYGTMLHEMGHALGLGGHSPDSADVMYPRVNADGHPELTERDRATLRALYAKPNGHRVTGPKRVD